MRLTDCCCYFIVLLILLLLVVVVVVITITIIIIISLISFYDLTVVPREQTMIIQNNSSPTKLCSRTMHLHFKVYMSPSVSQVALP